MKQALLIILNGFLIGIANLIPGVSGGTFALILGLYDRLLKAVSSINITTILSFFKLLTFKKESFEEFLKELKRIDINFLLLIGVGVLLSTVGGASFIKFALKQYPEPTLALFVGFILTTLKAPYKMIEEKSIKTLVLLVLGICTSIVPSFLWNQGGGSDSLIAAFLTGSLAISAMILPGISGSYIMLILGQYQIVLEKLSKITSVDSILFLICFAAGCGIGVIIFTKLVRFLLKHYQSLVMSFLLGLILGSFYLLWPFKDFTSSKDVIGRDGKVKKDIQIATAKNQIPSENGRILIVLGVFVVGSSLGILSNKMEVKKESKNS